MKNDIGITIAVIGVGGFLALVLNSRYGAKTNRAIDRVIGNGSAS